MIKIKRQPDNGVQTLGELEAFCRCMSIFKCKTLELAYKDNLPFISCIKKGIYDVVKRWSKKYGFHFRVLDKNGRYMILIHVLNKYKQTEGCIGVGEKHTDIDGDGFKDVTNSKKTLSLLYDLMPDKFKLEIT